MGQQSTVPRNSNQSARTYTTLRNEQFYNRRIEHQGLIKLRPVPFKNCIQIQTDNGSRFLENIQITLKDLLQSRLYTNKLFPKEDIERLIENIAYTLAFLSENGIPYKDVSSQNIFYDDGSFKLLPNELIAQSRYQKFLTYTESRKPIQQSQKWGQFVPLSPQMIIAYRCKEPQINDIEIIDKSNVFYLGILLLEATTLLPAYECYDIESCDILDEVISERIELIKEYYSEEIASIVANLLDYDYVERVTLKEASIFVNRELNRDVTLNGKVSRELSNKKPKQPILLQSQEPVCSDPLTDQSEFLVHQSQIKNSNMCKSRVQNVEVSESRISKPTISTIQKSEKKKNKTNKVYINGVNGAVQEVQQQSVSFSKEQKNKVYMRQITQQQSKRQLQTTESQLKQDKSLSALRQQNMNDSQILTQKPTTPIKQNQNTGNIPAYQGSVVRAPTGKVANNTAKERITSMNSSYTMKTNPYQPNIQEDVQNIFPPQNQDFAQQKSMKNKNSKDYIGYRASSTINITQKTPTKFQQKSEYQYEDYEQNISKNNFTYHQNNKQDSAYSYPTKNAFGKRYNERESTFNQDSNGRIYLENNKPSSNYKPSLNADFKNQDNSLSRIKSQIQRSRKLIQEFKRGENLHY